jgi:hypothetical protein
MPVYTIQSPDGRKIKIEAADQATALRGAQEWASTNPRKKPSAIKDAANSFVTGVAQGVNGLTQLRGDAAQLTRTVTPRAKLPDFIQAGYDVASMVTNGLPSSIVNKLVGADYKPQTVPGEYARTIGQNVPNALVPGGPVARTAAVLLPAVGSETAGQIARRSGAGPIGETAARVAGGVAGGGLASVRIQPRPKTAVTPLPRQDPEAVAQRAAEYRAAGIEPTLVDVVDEGGRGAVRAAATRMTPGRQVAQDFGDARALDLPDRISTQARTHMSSDPRTPMQIADELGQARAQAGDAAFGAVRGEAISMAPETVQALRSDYGRRAISEAAQRERDPEVRAALLRLANAALDDPSTQITVGMADRISRVLLGQAQAASRQGDNDLAATLGNLGRSVREPAKAASPGYGAALEQYGAQSRMIDAADRGEDFLKRSTDDFVADVGNMAPDERQLALATGRRAVERAAGESVASAPGVARRLSTAPEQRARNNALLGDRAPAFENAMRLEERTVQNARQVAPKTGSWTSQNEQDAARMAGAVQVGRRILSGDKIGLAMDWLRSRGMNDQQAEALVRMATDPAQTDQAIALIAQRYGPQAAKQFLTLRQAALMGAGVTTSAAAPARDDQRR